MKQQTLISHSPEETQRLARRLVPERAPTGPVVTALEADLGGGKPCFVQGTVMALGMRAPVTSPAFTPIHEYAGRRPLYYLDFHRIRSDAGAVQAGLGEHLEADGITVIEWPERAAYLLTPQAISIRSESMNAQNDRRIEIRHQDAFSLAD